MNENNASPILIYQMGKVGSKTVEATLKQLGLPNRIYHAHFLSWSGIEAVERYYAGCGQPRRLDHSRKIREFLDNNPTLRCKVITLVRDYVSREVSDLFENIKTTLPEATAPGLSSSQSQGMIEQYLAQLFGRFNTENDYACTWFDKELKDVFGFDIFSVPFDAQRGYQIYSTARADILCIRLEDLSRVYQAAFQDFLGVSVPHLVIDNEGSDKQSREVYQQIKSCFRVPESVLKPIYQSRLMRHFYTDDEIARFKTKWLKAPSTTEHSQQIGRILLIHSEGNVNNNPNLSGLVEILCEQGYQVDIASPRRKGISQKSPHPNARLLLVDDKRAKVAGELVLLAGKPLSTVEEIAAAVGAVEPYDFIFGVDRAIIEASIIAHSCNIPYGLISYEIFFADEAGADYKESEIAACRDIAFAVCQDPVRGGCLSRENRIPPDKMIYIPVAGRGIVPRQKTCALHQKLGIDPTKKIAIYCGNVDSYCMIDELIQSALEWPDDWALVIHNRYGLDKKTVAYYERYGGSNKILFSQEAVDTPDQMHTLLNSADIGIAFYRPEPNNKWIGNNIRHIGLASGKISTYLQHGLPIWINELGQISDYVEQYKLGMVHRGTSRIEVPGETELTQWARNTQTFFSRYLDLNKTAVPLLERLSAILQVPRKVEVVSQHAESKGNGNYLVSAIVSTYNSEAFIRGCLQDLVEQTLYQKGQLEIVVVNSGSQENEEAIVKEYQSHYPHIQYIKTSQRETIYAAWNRGIRAARGRYITNANTDDRHAPEMMEKQASALEQNPDVAGVYSYFCVTHTPNQTWQNKTVVKVETWHPAYSHENLLKGNFMGPFPMWRRSLHDEYGWFDPALKVAGDYEFFLRVSQTHPMMLIREPLGLYYYNPSSLERSAGTRDQEDQWIKQLYRESRGRMIRRPFYPADDEQSSPESQRDYLLAGALKLFQKAQRAFAAGNMLTARKVMAQYQAVMNYDHLPRVDRRDPSASPLMSVIIVTYQRSDDVLKLLDCFRRQTDRDFEIIVVDNGGTDIRAAASRADCIIPCPINFNLSEGRNIGAWFARGKIAVFVDDDALVEADYTASVRQAFETYNVLGLRGRTLPKTPVSNKHISICDRGDKPFLTLCNQEGNSAFLLWAWRAVGGQDPLLFGHEGTDITWRMIHAFGRQDVVMYWPDTVIYHDYGDGGKTRRKRRQQDINQDYLLYKYDQSISDIRSQLETLPLTEGNALLVQPVVPAEGKRWYGLCYQDNLHKLSTVPSPKVAVVIACQNMAEYLPQCLDGIRAQTLKEWETLIVDDGSTDGSREILQRYAQLDKRFRLYFFDKSEGPYVRRNFAIQHARAPFISIQDADDILAPQKLEMLLEEILRDDSLGVVGSFFGRFIDRFRGPEYCDRIRLQVSHAEIVKTYQHSFYVCWHASAIIRKTLFEQVGLYDCQPWGSDTFWLAKAAMYGILTGTVRFKNLPEIVTYKREHKKSQTGTILLNHPNGRRKVLSRYGQQKLIEIAQKAREIPGFDVGQAIRNCNCNDFIPRFGHLFEQWESGAVTQQMIAGLLSKAMHEFCSGYCSDSLISLNSLCDVCRGAEKQIQGLNLLRGLCQFIAGEDELACLSLRQEYADHGTVQAGDFLSRYLTQTDARQGGIQRRQIVDRFVYIDTLKSSIESEVIYDNRDAATPKVSVILDCRRGKVDLETVIAEWTMQTERNFELLILTAGNSKADFAGQTLPLRSAVLNFAEGAIHAAVKNRAVSFARGEILLFVRWQIAVKTDCIATVQDALSTPAIGAVSGRIVSAAGGWNTNLDYGDRKLFCCLDQDMLCAVKRDVFERAGGLDEGLWGREMLSLSWAIYEGADTDFGSILYVPELAGAWRADAPKTTDYVLRQLAADQLYWRRSCPGKYWSFIRFAECCVWAVDESGQCDPDQAGQVVQFFTGRHRAIALQWARLAYRLKSNRLGELYALANCEWDAGNIEQGARYYQQVLAVPFMRGIESRVLSPEERSKVSEIIHCYVTAALKLAKYHQDRGQNDIVRRMLEQLKTNPNCVLDAEQQTQFDLLYQGVRTRENNSAPALTASRNQGPLVSVIMPAYNSAAYIDAAIRSVLAQTYPDFELIIVNDGSTDQTEQVIHNYRDSRIRCLSQANAGLAATRNAAIRHATGQFIVPLDDDDRMKPEFIAQHVAAFEQHPEADLIYCDDHLVNEAGQSLRVIRRKEVSDPNQLICGLFQGGFPFIPFRTCIRRSVFDKIGLYDESLRVAEDYDMMRRFAAQGLIARHLAGDFYIRCVRTDSLSRNHTRTKAETHFGVIRRFIETFSWEQLFPDAHWAGLAPVHREFQGRYMSACVFQAIRRNYVQNRTPGFYAETAMDFAIEQLEQCLELSPDNPDVKRRLNEWHQQKSQFTAGLTV